jgi:hypothetical protein
MSPNQIEHVLEIIDGNISSNMESVRSDVLDFMTQHADELARQISENGYGIIPTKLGDVTVSKDDLQALSKGKIQSEDAA